MSAKIETVPVERLERVIILVRGQKVLLDRDLAALYCVETRVLNQAVRRNLDRFPADFMFELNRQEIGRISQFVTSSSSLKFSKKVHVFTEQGVAMLSGVLNSPRAIQVNIEIMRAFVRLRQMLATNTELERRIVALERKYNRKFKIVFDAIRELMNEEETEEAPPREIGFHTIPSSTKARSRRVEKILP
jgi:hypothetical protein